jgi:pimeloyl-ACP methyl ester carboxylesterase
MAMARVRDIDMYYEESGKAGGEPVVLIAGLSLNTTTWFRQAPALAGRYRVIAFDNRGAGRTDKPARDYSIALFADDTASLMDALGIDSAHVCGMSMGGMIAQELALRHPARVRSLMLICTTPGGGESESPQVTLGDPANAGMTPAEIFDRSLAWFYSDAWGTAHRDEIVRRALEHAHLRIDPDQFARQARAIRGDDDGAGRHDTYARLAQIAVPTLVLAGEEDPLVPVANSRVLGARIPGARYVEYAGARHYFHIERAGEVNAELLAFLDRVTAATIKN